MRVKRRWNRINEQILVWAGDKRQQLKYNGVPIILPAHDETAKLGAKEPFRFGGARDSKDRLIPGTIVVADVISRTSEGGVTKTFDVGEFCDFLERDQSYWFDRGLEIVTDVADVPAAMETARPVWVKAQVSRAQQIISTEMDRLAKFEAKGQPAPEASNAADVAWAISHLRDQAPDKAKFGRDELAGVLSGQYVPAEKEGPLPTAESMSAKEVLAEAKEVGIKLTKTELEGLLEDDEDQIAFIKEKIAGRREDQAATA